MAIRNISALKPSSDVVHLIHYKDGYPLCWAMAQSDEFEGTRSIEEVSCPDCLYLAKGSVDAS